MADATSRLLEGLERLVRRITARVDYLALYPSVVSGQDADGRLHLVPEDIRLSSCRGVPIRLGIPGVTVRVATGARVLLGFEAGDPARPVATLWESGSVTELVVNGATTGAARVGDSVARSTAFATWMANVTTATGVAPGPATIGAVSTASSVVKIP